MTTVTAHNSSLLGAGNLSRSQEMLSRSLARLSSGSKIVSPADDAAGLAVSAKMDSQQRRLQAASTNVQNAASRVQTADGFLGGITKVISRMSELTTLSRDVVSNPQDVALYQKEFRAVQDQLRSTIGGTTAQIGGTSGVESPLATFNGSELFGPDAKGTTLTIGSDSAQTLTLPETNLREGAVRALIAQDAAGNYTLATSDDSAGATLTGALEQISGDRAALGGALSRLDMAGSTLSIEQQNLSSALSRIRDVDIASESTQLAKYNILVESSTAMLAQSNQSSSSVLKLLQS